MALVALVALAGDRALNAQAGKAESMPPGAATFRVDPSLMADTLQSGTSRVIVGLRLPWKAEGLVASAEREVQRSAIAAAQSRLADDLRGTGAEILHNYETIPFQVQLVTPAALGKLVTSSLVSSIEPDQLFRTTLAQSVPLIQADQAWAAGYTGAGIAVAVLDTGVEATHSFFGGRVAAEGCFSTTVSGQSTTLCPNGANTQVGAGASDPANCAGIGGCDHGTHVSGITAGAGGSFSGVAKGASIIGVKVFSRFSAAVCGGAPCLSAYNSDVLRGLEHVFSLRDSFTIASVNMSLGGGKHTSEATCDASNTATKAAIDNLRSVGIATVIASGNESYTDGIAAPGCISTAVAVGSTTKADAVSSFSNSSPMVELLAPGSSINSSITGNAFGVQSGTSMAAPHVAGAWAILKQAKPTASVTELLNAFASTGLGVTDPRNGVVKPRIRVKSALDVVLPPPPTISINDASVAEGDAGTPTASFTVSLSSTYPQAVSVNFATAAGTAASGTDFLAVNGTLTFPAGVTTRALSVTVVGDRLSEGNETFLVNLSSPVNGTILDSQGVGTIVDNDAFGFAISDVTIAEPRSGTVNAVFTVTLSGGGATVGFTTTNGVATAPADYTTTTGTLTFAAGVASQTIAVPIKFDAVAEGPETLFVDLQTSSGPAIVRSRGTATIYDPGLYTLAPCRVLDTRDATQGPALSAGSTRTVVVGGKCGVPVGASAVSLNITVVSPTGAGDLRIYPSNLGLPLVSAINYGVGQTRANNATFALSPDGLLSVFCEQASGAVDLIVDVNGYLEVGAGGSVGPVCSVVSPGVADGTFEAGDPWPSWTTQSSTTFGTPICDVVGCGTVASAAPLAGTDWVWFGGIAASPETSTLGQSLVLPSSPDLRLRFQLWIGGVTAPATDTLAVRVDGNLVQTYTEPATAETGYTQREISLTPFANGATHSLLFTYTHPAAGTANFNLDNLQLIDCR